MKKFLVKTLYGLNFYKIFKKFYHPYNLRIICYHSVCESHEFLPNWLCISKSNFINQLRIIKQHFNIISFSELDLVKSRKIKNPLIITFDDGLADNYHTVMPILESENLKATFYLNTVYLENKDEILWTHNLYILNNLLGVKKIFKYFNLGSNISVNNLLDLTKYIRNHYSKEEIIDKLKDLNLKFSLDFKNNNFYLNKDQIIDMLKRGMTIGCHGIDHFDLTKISNYKKETIESRNFLNNLFHIDIKNFAYPFGDPQSFNNNINKELFPFFDNLCTTIPGINNTNKNLYKRICSYEMSREKLLLKLLIGI
ncbi:MAG: polysaccharide deacetylase family protein [Patescibacteria group bacterium]|nr:polysaccharide deacetylase family protein [Patescibacteria group bacterium]